MAVCSFCASSSEPTAGTSSPGPADGESLPLTWVTSYENGKRRVYCDRCAREHVRSIESKLDSEWW